MKKLLFGTALIVLLGAGCTAAPPPAGSNVNTQAEANVPANTPVASAKFVDQPYYKYAYLISGPSLDKQTKDAITGFAITKKALAGGATEFDLKALKTEYKDQVYTVKPGEKLYFLEKFMGDDDTEKNEEKFMGDDQAVVVDADGNVIGAPVTWSK